MATQSRATPTVTPKKVQICLPRANNICLVPEGNEAVPDQRVIADKPGDYTLSALQVTEIEIRLSNPNLSLLVLSTDVIVDNTHAG